MTSPTVQGFIHQRPPSRTTYEDAYCSTKASRRALGDRVTASDLALRARDTKSVAYLDFHSMHAESMVRHCQRLSLDHGAFGSNPEGCTRRRLVIHCLEGGR